jgi:hypothetical protein
MRKLAPKSGIDYERLAAELAPRVSTLVLARLATALVATEAPYSTRRGFEPPEYMGRPARWKQDAPTIPGAVKLGRWWSVSRAAYAAWVEKHSVTTSAPAVAPANDAPAWSPRAALAAVGLRANGGGR